jgi:hypothetical protein
LLIEHIVPTLACVNIVRGDKRLRDMNDVLNPTVECLRNSVAPATASGPAQEDLDSKDLVV